MEVNGVHQMVFVLCSLSRRKKFIQVWNNLRE